MEPNTLILVCVVILVGGVWLSIWATAYLAKREEKPEIVGKALLGLLMLLPGLAGLVFFFVGYDIYVDFRGELIVNQGRVSDRNAGLVVSGVVAVIGTLFMTRGGSSHKDGS